MEDLFRKIPSLVKSSSKGSSPLSSRSTTPSPPPTTLPPPLPAPDIPIQLPVGPLLPPPLITAGDSLGVPISLPPPLLTQTAVFQRDRAARVFEHSPLNNQLSCSDAASQYQQWEQIEKQRGRYRSRGEPADTRKSASRSLSPRGKPNEKVQKKKKHGTLVPPLSPTVSPAAEEIPVKEPRFGPATTFEEILGIDGANCVSPDDLAFYVSGSSATAFGTGFTARRVRKDPVTRIVEVYSGSDVLSWVEEGYPATESTRPSFFCEASPPPGVAFSCSRNEIEPLSRPSFQAEVSTYATDDEAHPQEVEGGWIEPKCTGLDLHIDSHGGVAPLLSPTSDASVSSTKHKSYIPQMDGSFVSQSQNLTDFNLVELPRLPDPFGLRAAIPTEDAVRVSEEDRRISFLQKCKDFIRLNSRNIRARIVHALTTGPDMNDNTDFEMDPGEAEEDIGTRKAKAVSRCWNRTDLVVCYSCIVVLTAYFSLGHFHSVFIIKEALNYWAAKGEIKIYQFELALSMPTVTRILGIMSFAKLTNVYSRPRALFIAIIFAIGGVGISAFAMTWESFCAGHALFHFGRSGALVVAQVIVADTSDLSWRGCFTWGLEFGSVFWVWSTPVVEKLITSKIGWHVPIWSFFSFAFPVAIPPLTTIYLYHRRVLRLGLFPQRNIHRRVWWSLRGFSNKLLLFGIELDLLGVLLWTVGVGLLTTALSLSEKMQAGIGMWMGALLVGGGLTIIVLVVWEVWLNNGLKTIRRLERQRALSSGHPARFIDHCSHTGSSSNVALDERTAIDGHTECDSVLVDRVATQISTRILASQDASKVARWRGLSSCRERSHPLFRTRLLKRRTIPLGCLIGFLANFSMRTGSWVVWERPELLPLDYRQLVEFVQGGEILTNIGFTTLIMGGLLVSLMIQVTKLFKWFVVSGLLLIMCGLLTFHSAEIYVIGQRQLIFVQIFTGLGAGMVDIGLMVGVQASCKRHSDVAISIGLLKTFNAVGRVTAEAMKRLMQTYLLSLLPVGSSREVFVRALNGHWGVMILVAFAAAAFALVIAGVGLAGHNLDEVEQHVSGVVFGADDTERQNSDEEHINRSRATLPPFIPHPRDANIQPFQLVSAPSGTIEAGTQVGWNNVPPQPKHLKGPTSTESRAQGSSKSNVIGTNRNSMQVCESTADWETFASESITSSTSNSCAVMSPVRVASSYMDGMFTMDMDMEKTPRAAAPSILEPHGEVNKDFSNSLPVSTLTSDAQNTIKRDHYKSRQADKPAVITETSIIGGEGFSFKKRKIGIINQRQASSWNNRERKPILPANVISGSSILSEDLGETTQPNSFTHDFAVNQISSEVSPEELSPDGVEGPNIQGRLTSELDGRVSRFSYRDEEPTSVRISGKSQLNVDDIMSEVNALTEKNGCSLEQCLSPITELSSRDSLEDAAASALEESLNNGGSSSRRAPTVIGVLSPNHLRMQDRPKEKGTASLRKSPIFAITARRNGKGVQKNKMAKYNRNR